MTYTNIPKPSANTYKKLGPVGDEFFDDDNVLFDSTTVFFDGTNSAMWTDIEKPNGFGLRTWASMTMTWAEADEEWGNDTAGWTNIPKPV